MTRKERKAAAEQRKRDHEERWAGDMRSLIASGTPWKQAHDQVKDKVMREIASVPQQKHELVEAWNRLIKRIQKHADAIAAEQAQAKAPSDTYRDRAIAEIGHTQ